MFFAISRDQVTRLFRFSMWWRIIYGSLKLLLGLYLMRHVGSSFYDLLDPLVAQELAEDPHDNFIQSMYGMVHKHQNTVTYFVSLYFIFWGVMDVILSFLLLKRMMWAFPVSQVLIGLFVLYEIIRVTRTHSLILFFVIVIDIGIMYLIHEEYKKYTTESRQKDI